MSKRILLVSDVHYTTDLSEAEMKKIHPEALASAASGTAFGLTQRQKIDKMLADILREHENNPLDAILFLGDMSIDDADFRRLPDNYCLKFRDECMAHFPCPAYVIPGNHDSHGNDVWKSIFGTDRQHTVKLDGLTVIMLDTFNHLPATAACGSTYSGIDVEWLKAELERADDQPIILCAHHFNESADGPAMAELVQDKRVICLFRGHTHHHEVLSYFGKPLVDIGGYAYEGMKGADGKYTFQVFDPKWAWGYEMLELDENGFTVRHEQTDMHYDAANGVFDLERETFAKIG